MKKSQHFPEAFYRVTIRGLMQDGDKFLLGHQKSSDTWETFGGGLDFDEDIHEALKREILEEVGCEVSYISKSPILVIPHIVHNKRGLDWFYSLSVYYRVKFDISNFNLDLQYSELKWFTLEEMQDLPIFEGEDGIKQGFKVLLNNKHEV